MSLPRVLLVGDSIRIGYAPLVRTALANRAEVFEIPENGGDSRNVRSKLAEWLELADGPTLTVVHLNCGLHDIKRPFGSSECQQPLSAYRKNLKAILQELRERTSAQPIWASTTPVLEARHRARKGFDRLLADVQRYNAAAAEIMNSAGVPINDLYEVVLQAGVERCIGEDGVHMTPFGNRILAEAVAACLQGWIAGQ
ncbi:MAG: hypothetical protein KatS3mg115_0203 [Candidatus Poribacteria bacterium]|nr:MAG: hypothetical protein KatS3mg115_0203 [Candidatus Poribacteria bacterium]